LILGVKDRFGFSSCRPGPRRAVARARGPHRGSGSRTVPRQRHRLPYWTPFMREDEDAAVLIEFRQQVPA
jgi:hypothetical protein